MLPEIETALGEYNTRWKTLVENRADKTFFSNLKPVAVGWKVADPASYAAVYNALRPKCDRIIETWMNGRWVAKMHLKDETLTGGIKIVKILERRPGSTDKLGLDHVDFYSPVVKDAEVILKNESNLHWTHETNDAFKGYSWISVWFDDTEAKLKSDTVMDIVIHELQDINKSLKA